MSVCQCNIMNTELLCLLSEKCRITARGKSHRKNHQNVNHSRPDEASAALWFREGSDHASIVARRARFR